MPPLWQYLCPPCLIHVEDLAAHLAGREHRDTEARWDGAPPGLPSLGGQRQLVTTAAADRANALAFIAAQLGT